MAIKCTMHGPVAVVAPQGTLWGGDETNELRELIDGLIEKGNAQLVIDLGRVNHLNSTALGLLVSSHTNYTKREGSVKLCGVEKRISNLLLITKLSMVFDVHKNVDEAVASFSTV
jgi:anti-sigma B factor antagonist